MKYKTMFIETTSYGSLIGQVNQLITPTNGWRVDRLGARYQTHFPWRLLYSAVLSHRLPPSQAGQMTFIATQTQKVQ